MTDELRETTLSGKAYNAKAGAVLVLDDETPVYIEGMNAWEDEMIGQTIELTGILQSSQAYPQAEEDENGMIIQGMSEMPASLRLTKPFDE